MAESNERKSRIVRNNRDKNPIKSEIDTTLNTFSFNVDQATKDAKKVYANLESQHKTYLRSVEKSYKSTYTRIYNDLTTNHQKYLRNLIHNEKLAQQKVAEIWGSDVHNVTNPRFTDLPRNKDKDNNEPSNPNEKSFNVGKAITDTLWKTAKYLGNIFITGSDQFVESYTRNFNTLTTAFNTNYQGITDKIFTSVSHLDEIAGANYNITKDLMPALVKVAQSGLQGDKAIAKATDDVISSKIMPYLDTSTDTWTNLYANISETNIKTLKGQQLLLKQSEAGSRLLQSGVINSLTDDLEPLLRDIEYNTSDRDMGAYQGVMQNLVSSGFTEREAYDAIKTAIEARKSPFTALQSGSTASVLAGIDVAQGGTGLTGLGQAYSLLGSANTAIGVGAIRSAMGINLPADTTELATAAINAFTASSSSPSSQAALNYYDESVSQMDDVVHNTDKFNNTLENWGAHTLGYLQKDVAKPITDILKIIGAGVTTIAANTLFKGVSGTIGNALKTGGSKIVSGVTKLGSTAGASGLAATGLGTLGAGSAVYGVVTAGKGIYEMVTADTSEEMTRGAAKTVGPIAGAVAGALIAGPLGAALGAGVGALASEIGSAIYKSDYEKAVEKVDKLSSAIQDLNEAASNQSTIDQLTSSYESLTAEQRAELEVLKETTRVKEQLAKEQINEAVSDFSTSDVSALNKAVTKAQSKYEKALKSGDSEKIEKASSALSQSYQDLYGYYEFIKHPEVITSSSLKALKENLGGSLWGAGQADKPGFMSSKGISDSEFSAWKSAVIDNESLYKYDYSGDGKIGSYAVGTDYVGYDQIAKIHQGEAVLTKADSNLLRTVGASTASSISAYIEQSRKSTTEIVDAIKWAAGQLIAALGSSVTTSTSNGNLNIKLPQSTNYNESMISLVKFAMS